MWITLLPWVQDHVYLALPWAATVTSFAGIYTVSAGKPALMARGMVLYLIGSILWGTYGYITDQWHLFLLNCGYCVVEWRAYRNWRQQE